MYIIISGTLFIFIIVILEPIIFIPFFNGDQCQYLFHWFAMYMKLYFTV